MLAEAASSGVQRIRLHAITDGRDVLPDSSLSDIPEMDRFVSDLAASSGVEQVDARIATVTGRYWAMDRDARWERTARAWNVLVHGEGVSAPSASDAVRTSHAAGTTDEFIEPTILDPDGVIRDGDVIIFANFRPDRMRQIVRSFVQPADAAFDRGENPPAVDVYCMAEYDSVLELPVAFPPAAVDHCLADVLEEHGIGQLHVAETEKYAHVTYFFDGGTERLRDGEHRELAPSPRDVATYDLKPEMNASRVADLFTHGFANPQIGFGIVNFANPDMVGHTGVLEAAVAACEEADRQLARVVEAVHARGGVCIVTADHGNAETMRTESGEPHTAHTTNPVPVVITVPGGSAQLREGGRLADIAPTILKLMGIPAPAGMTGVSLA
jgi:2,3-bisphosphoglycerate-independent phosphoglycerate mutase